MQRFKKLAMSKGNVDAHGQPVIFGKRYGWAAVPGTDPRKGKFVYGADGTISQAARWREQAVRHLRIMRGCVADGGFDARWNAQEARYYLAAAWKGGCRLPA